MLCCGAFMRSAKPEPHPAKWRPDRKLPARCNERQLVAVDSRLRYTDSCVLPRLPHQIDHQLFARGWQRPGIGVDPAFLLLCAATKFSVARAAKRNQRVSDETQGQDDRNHRRRTRARGGDGQKTRGMQVAGWRWSTSTRLRWPKRRPHVTIAGAADVQNLHGERCQGGGRRGPVRLDCFRSLRRRSTASSTTRASRATP